MEVESSDEEQPTAKAAARGGESLALILEWGRLYKPYRSKGGNELLLGALALLGGASPSGPAGREAGWGRWRPAALPAASGVAFPPDPPGVWGGSHP